jgi:hypothetical protein
VTAVLSARKRNYSHAHRQEHFQGVREHKFCLQALNGVKIIYPFHHKRRLIQGRTVIYFRNIIFVLIVNIFSYSFK